ncbi:hypothetical protein GCM10011396_38720 [Undibacterium terreum]|uniref:Uncharacterized protein n=1 Tax=Undibacterium terreum TaxID=1224302 RepID=A0A916UVZ8_9BURK|nr:hypothetical protein GCM10011396_38720 [Undibacterium terreum]
MNAKYILIETVNTDRTEAIRLRGREFQVLLDVMAVEDHVVVDVGTSEVEEFFSQMKNYQGSHEDFDLFIIPTVSALKPQRDTAKTVFDLIKMGFKESNIRIIFNMVGSSDDVTEVFKGVFDLAKEFPGLKLDAEVKIFTNDLFPQLEEKNVTIDNILADATDYKALMKLTEDPSKRRALSQRRNIKLLAHGLSDHLNTVFGKLIV